MNMIAGRVLQRSVLISSILPLSILLLRLNPSRVLAEVKEPLLYTHSSDMNFHGWNLVNILRLFLPTWLLKMSDHRPPLHLPLPTRVPQSASQCQMILVYQQFLSDVLLKKIHLIVVSNVLLGEFFDAWKYKFNEREIWKIGKIHPKKKGLVHTTMLSRPNSLDSHRGDKKEWTKRIN
jgi:hypothetical protein